MSAVPPKRRRRIQTTEQQVVIKSELDIFNPRPVQTAIADSYWVDVHPISALSDDSPITFFISGSEEDFLDPVVYLKIDCAVKTKDGQKLPENIAVAPINLFGHSMFKRIDVKIQDKVISTDNYPYRAYIERMLNYGTDAKSSQLTTEGFYMDKAGAFDVLGDKGNGGFIKRRNAAKESKRMTFFVRLSTDIGNQPRLLPNNIDVTFTLHPSSNAFRLAFPRDVEAPTVDLTSLLLYVRRVKLSPPMATAIAETMRLKPALYPINHVIVKTYQIPPGHPEINRENLSVGTLPRAVVIGIVESDAYVGTGAKSPFNFQQKGSTFISLYRDSEPIPSVAYTPRWAERDAVREYLSLFQVTSSFGANRGIGIDYDDYLSGGYALYGFDLTPDESPAGMYGAGPRQGNLSLKMQFEVGNIDQTCTLIAFMVYDSVLYIDNNRNVITDFT